MGGAGHAFADQGEELDDLAVDPVEALGDLARAVVGVQCDVLGHRPTVASGAPSGNGRRRTPSARDGGDVFGVSTTPVPWEFVGDESVGGAVADHGADRPVAGDSSVVDGASLGVVGTAQVGRARRPAGVGRADQGSGHGEVRRSVVGLTPLVTDELGR